MTGIAGAAISPNSRTLSAQRNYSTMMTSHETKIHGGAPRTCILVDKLH